MDNIHPINKKPIGERLARAVLANHYHKNIEWKSPTLIGAELKKGEIVLSFDHAANLIAKGDKPEGFFVTTESGDTYAAEAALYKNTVRIPYSPDIAAVGFCNRNYAVVNVYNENDLPLFPFEHSIINISSESSF